MYHISIYYGNIFYFSTGVWAPVPWVQWPVEACFVCLVSFLPGVWDGDAELCLSSPSHLADSANHLQAVVVQRLGHAATLIQCADILYADSHYLVAEVRCIGAQVFSRLWSASVMVTATASIDVPSLLSRLISVLQWLFHAVSIVASRPTLFLFRLHRMHEMLTIVTDLRGVCLSACLSVTQCGHVMYAVCAGSFGTAFAKCPRPVVQPVLGQAQVELCPSLVTKTTSLENETDGQRHTDRIRRTRRSTNKTKLNSSACHVCTE